MTHARRMCSPTRTDKRYCHGAAREVGGRGIVIGLPYSIVAWESQRGSSFSPPVNIERLQPEQKATAVAADQVLWLGLYTPPWIGASRWMALMATALCAAGGQRGAGRSAHPL